MSDKDQDGGAVRRVPVDFDYECINPEFLKWMAKIGPYAAAKYGSWSQYAAGRLTGDKAPLNHVEEHKRAFVMGEKYDHFDGDVRWHLVAIAYNVMMEFYYTTKFGHVRHPLALDAAADADWLQKAAAQKHSEVDWATRERAALPDGTRVRLVCQCSRDKSHEGIFVTSWSPRRTGIKDDPDDYRLTREGDGYVTYAVRSVLEVIP